MLSKEEHKEFGKKIKVAKKTDRQMRHEKVVEIIDSLKLDKENSFIVDNGCGWGQICEMLKERGYSYHGFEPTPERVEYCNKRGLDVSVSALPRIPLDDNSVNVLVFTEVLEHLENIDYDITFMEINRVLKSGGHVIITVPENKESLYDYHHKRIVTYKDILMRLKEYTPILRTTTYRDKGYEKYKYNPSMLLVLKK